MSLNKLASPHFISVYRQINLSIFDTVDFSIEEENVKKKINLSIFNIYLSRSFVKKIVIIQWEDIEDYIPRENSDSDILRKMKAFLENPKIFKASFK